MRHLSLKLIPGLCIFLVAAGVSRPAKPAPTLAAETMKVVTALMDSARAEGLPADILLQKALEGATKGANEQRIREAVRALLNRLRLARTVLGRDASEPELSAASGAIYAGVDTSDIGRLGELQSRRVAAGASGERTLTAELVVLTDLISRDVPVDAASHVVIGLAEANVGYDEMLEFRNAVERDIRSGTVPVQSAFRRAKRIVPSLPPLGQESIQRGASPR
jgi:hypothetical protein